MLGHLARDLRCLGYDGAYDPDEHDDARAAGRPRPPQATSTLALALGIVVIMALARWVMPLWRATRRGPFGRRWASHHDPDEGDVAGSAAPYRIRDRRQTE